MLWGTEEPSLEGDLQGRKEHENLSFSEVAETEAMLPASTVCIRVVVSLISRIWNAWGAARSRNETTEGSLFFFGVCGAS